MVVMCLPNLVIPQTIKVLLYVVCTQLSLEEEVQGLVGEKVPAGDDLGQEGGQLTHLALQTGHTHQRPQRKRRYGCVRVKLLNKTYC